jgi:Lrp/AsnC family leucine-responsive transcriptional regulator
MFDRNDLEILKILQKNARAPVSEIAKELKLSRPTVKNKIERLVREGIIKGFTIELNREVIEKT